VDQVPVNGWAVRAGGVVAADVESVSAAVVTVPDATSTPAATVTVFFVKRILVPLRLR
jgi:hypothetical protein